MRKESWFSESAEERILPKLRRRSIDSLFCCSDRLAVAAIACYARLKRPVPPLISFDNTPLAEQLHISVIGIPWERICKEAAAIVKLRLAGLEEAASCQILPPQPVLRILREHVFDLVPLSGRGSCRSILVGGRGLQTTNSSPQGL
jgi:DNA-binding LacI/PurR family transcriptional regulator